jgi:hypothetical protein
MFAASERFAGVYGHVLDGGKEEAVRSIDTALNRGKTSQKVSERRG